MQLFIYRTAPFGQTRAGCRQNDTILSRFYSENAIHDTCGHVAFVEAAEEFDRDVAAFMQRFHG